MLYSAEQVASFATERFAFVQTELRDHVLYLTINRPHKKNAMNPTLMYELGFALSYAHHSHDVWAVVFAANGNVFCAGADLKAFSGQDDDPGDSSIPKLNQEVLIGELFMQTHKPIIARVHAPVLAGGFLLICGCHYVVAAPEATFSLPEAKRGIWPMQVMASLLQVTTPRHAIDLCLRGRTLGAEEAQKLGIVTHLAAADQLDSTVAQLLAEIFEHSPSAVRMGLEAFDHMRAIPHSEQHAYLKGMLGKVIQTQDAREGMQAFMQKRKPIWTGQ